MHPGVTNHLVPALLTLYKDVEYTERGDQFQSKFQFRKYIAELLEWLLTMPQHEATWAAVGAFTYLVESWVRSLLFATSPESISEHLVHSPLSVRSGRCLCSPPSFASFDVTTAVVHLCAKLS